MKRNISKTFKSDENIMEIVSWLICELPKNHDGTKIPDRVRVNICFDPDNKMSLIPKFK